MISKQFFKVKQKYDEAVRHGDKTELLTETLSQMYQTVELMKNTFSETNKKIKDTLISVNDDNKKSKNYKLILGQTLMSEAEKYDRDSLLHSLLSKLGQVVASLSIELSSYEMKIDDEFRKEISQLLNNDIANIMSERKKLSKNRLELDACRQRLKSAIAQNVSPQKQSVLENELSELSTKFEYLQDSFSIDLLNFISKEKQYALSYVSVLEAEREYHKNSLDILNKTLPDVRKLAESSNFHPIFGIPLMQLEETHGQIISPVLKNCAAYVIKNGLDVEGIFRLAGSANRIRKIKASFDAGLDILSEDNIDIFSVCACMKTYLRDLPEPLLTFKLENEWLEVCQLSKETKIEKITELVNQLPKPNYENLKFLTSFLVEVSSYSEKNKMTPANLGIVIGPNLLWSSKQDKVLLYTSSSSSVIDCLINNYNEIFEVNKTLDKIQSDETQVLSSVDKIISVEEPSSKLSIISMDENSSLSPPRLTKRRMVNPRNSAFYH